MFIYIYLFRWCFKNYTICDAMREKVPKRPSPDFTGEGKEEATRRLELPIFLTLSTYDYYLKSSFRVFGRIRQIRNACLSCVASILSLSRALLKTCLTWLCENGERGFWTFRCANWKSATEWEILYKMLFRSKNRKERCLIHLKRP